MRKLTNFIFIPFIALCALSLACAHFFNLIPPVFEAVSYTGSGKTPYSSSSLYVEYAEVEMKLSDENIKILINGDECDSVIGDSGNIVVTLFEGDVVEMDLRECNGEEVYVYVSACTKNVKTPAEKSKFFGRKGITPIFQLALK